MPGAQAIKAKVRDRKLAQVAAYRVADNPFEEGTRLHRYYIKARQRYENMESLLREMEAVYGPITPTPETKKPAAHECGAG